MNQVFLKCARSVERHANGLFSFLVENAQRRSRVSTSASKVRLGRLDSKSGRRTGFRRTVFHTRRFDAARRVIRACVNERRADRRVRGKTTRTAHREIANHFLAGDAALLRGSPIRRPDGISKPFLRTSSTYIHANVTDAPRRAALISYREDDYDGEDNHATAD